jgi:hypothetical protein
MSWIAPGRYRRAFPLCVALGGGVGVAPDVRKKPSKSLPTGGVLLVLRVLDSASKALARSEKADYWNALLDFLLGQYS